MPPRSGSTSTLCRRDHETEYDSVVIEYTKPLGFSHQRQSFTHCYNKHKDEYDWILMIDIDEYLIIRNNTLRGYLNDKIFDKCDTIKIHWLMARDNDLLYYENKSLFERFFNVNGYLFFIIF